MSLKKKNQSISKKFKRKEQFVQGPIDARDPGTLQTVREIVKGSEWGFGVWGGESGELLYPIKELKALF